MFPYKNILKLFSLNNEFSICFIYGEKINEIPQLLSKKNFLPGRLNTIVRFAYFILKNSVLRIFEQGYTSEKLDCIYFWGTKNQFESMKGSFEELKKSNLKCISLTDYRALVTSSDSVVRFSVLDLFRGGVLLLRRYKEFKLELGRVDSSTVIIANYLNVFLEPYFYIAYFYRILSRNVPKTIVMANDHNPINRSLLVVCKLLGIKTVYMQHANVTELFPPLEFDYALLDGTFAAQIYQTCDKNFISSKTTVFLSGQKKKLLYEGIDKKSNRLGIGLNVFEDIDALKKLVQNISCEVEIVIRWHPGQSRKDIKKIHEEIIDKMNNVTYSDPKLESQRRFFSNINVLIAGNTSLHLEASLARVHCFYYDMSNEPGKGIKDYYGFVKNGLVQLFPTIDQEISYSDIKKFIDKHKVPVELLKNYSETYNTTFENREALLSAELIKAITDPRRYSHSLSAKVDWLCFEKVYGVEQ